jgi:hypothetical protein
MILRTALAVLLATSAATAQAGRLVFEEEVKAIGTVYQHHEREVEFPFVVEGSDVRLDRYSAELDFHTSCGCTDAWVRADWLADEEGAGGEAPRWDIREPLPEGVRGTVVATFRGETWSRDKKSTILVRGNMEGGSVVLTIEAFVKRVFDVEPVLLDFGEILVAGLRAQDPSLEVAVTGKEAFAFEGWVGLPAGLTVEELGEPLLLKDGRMTRRLRFTLGGGTTPGSLTATASVETSLGLLLEIPVSARILPAVSFDPSRNLHFGFPRQGEVIERTVTVELQVDGARLPVPVVELGGALAGHMEVEVVARQAGRLYDVLVRNREDMPAGRFKGTLHIGFPADSGFAGHQMPVSITVRKQGQHAR